MALKTSKPKAEAPIIVLCAQEGAGKTSLAATFPKPIFIQAEAVTDVFDDWHPDDVPDVMDPLPMATAKKPNLTTDTLTNQILDLIEEDHEYETLVIDSISVLQQKLEHELCMKYGVTNVAECAGGYGKGYIELAANVLKFMELLKELRNERDMGILLLSHLEVQTLRNRPDSEAVITYALAMDKKPAAVYRQNASAVLSIRMDEFVQGTVKDKRGNVTKAGRVIMSGDRFLVTDASTNGFGLLCKNRWNLPAQIKLPAEENPLLDLIPYYKGN